MNLRALEYSLKETPSTYYLELMDSNSVTLVHMNMCYDPIQDRITPVSNSNDILNTGTCTQAAIYKNDKQYFNVNIVESDDGVPRKNAMVLNTVYRQQGETMVVNNFKFWDNKEK